MDEKIVQHVRAQTEPRLMTLDLLTIFGLLISFVMPLVFWSDLPDRIPSHFDLAGQPDAWSGKNSIWFLPGVSLFIFILIRLSRWLTGKYPHKTNIKDYNPQQQAVVKIMLTWVNLEMVWMFTVLTYLTIRVARGIQEGLGVWLLPVVLAVIFATIIYFFVKIVKTGREKGDRDISSVS